MPSKKKHLTLEQKIQLIADKDSGSSIDDLKQKFGVGKTAVYDIVNDRKEILKQIEDGANPKKKRMKFEDTPVNEATLSWFKTQRNKNVSMISSVNIYSYYVCSITLLLYPCTINA